MDYKSWLTKLELLLLMMVFELNDICLFIRHFKLESNNYPQNINLKVFFTFSHNLTSRYLETQNQDNFTSLDSTINGILSHTSILT